MTIFFELAISSDVGDRAAKIIQEASTKSHLATNATNKQRAGNARF